ncbi:TetR/AcrR family transcriptional regulator [Catalinimonas niigatensis]|uniref:TetR/AcrR family transcriptional regulator n=1 Tax=Catalinimonas niigatensis TaxID=1397264 RepID=UPI0026664882|nr:TetR/AcrR family transcriptional regulator [Catalinimonas niigatensis]WPP52294.1 TetR/AcrR family transcriptional regulator [Catalinimonas niigatensis]
MVSLILSDKYYIRDPQYTELGVKIISQSIKMVDELGFEQFTFKKLATEISSTEASIYRYFENKHKLLMYLIAWYWKWMEYLIDYRTNNIEEPERKLNIVLKTISEEVTFDPTFANIDEAALHRIVVAESNKTYLTKHVDEDNKEGLFRGYKDLCRHIANIIKEYNPDYPYPHALISTVIEASHQQAFFAQHLPSLTEVKKGSEQMHDKIFEYLQHLVLNTIRKD